MGFQNSLIKWLEIDKMIWYLIIAGLVGLGAFFIINELFLKNKNKETVYLAELYGLRSGTNVKNGFMFQDLVKISDDKLKVVERPDGTSSFELVKSGKTVSATKIGTVEIIKIGSKTHKRVRVLLSEDSCTLLESSYNSELGSQIFQPIPYDRSTAIRNDIYVKTNRYKNKSDMWAKIIPVVTILASLIAIVGTVFLTGGMLSDTAELQAKQQSDFNNLISDKMDDIVLASIISSGFTKDDLNSLAEEIHEIKDLKNGKTELGNQNLYKVNSTMNETRS